MNREEKKIKKLEKKIQKQIKLNNFLNTTNYALGGSKKPPKTQSIEDYLPWESEIIKEGKYESYQLEEEELEDDDLYEEN